MSGGVLNQPITAQSLFVITQNGSDSLDLLFFNQNKHVALDKNGH